MSSTALAVAKSTSLVAEAAGFDFSDLRIFASVPLDDDFDVVALRGAVVVVDRALISREGILEGALYVRESQHTFSCFPWQEWLRRELVEDIEHRRVQPVNPLKTRREVVQAVRWPRGESWAVRLASGFVDGPYHDWAFGSDLIGKVVGIYRPS